MRCSRRPMLQPSQALARVPGDVVVLGAGGKMGPSLARMAARARDAAGDGARRRIIAVSRFSSPGLEEALRATGVETISCDLLDGDAVARLPEAPNVVFMAGQKFGTSEAPSRTWMQNVVVPAICAARYAGSRVVAFSTGNVYPLTPVGGGGARETDPSAPVGEYAQSCVGRERVFEHFAATRGTKVAVMRLNYAIALRYGVLTDLARKVLRGESIPLAMGYVNLIWQGDANRAALALLPHASNPPLVMNVTGPATLSVRDLAVVARRAARTRAAIRWRGGSRRPAVRHPEDARGARRARDGARHDARLGGGVGAARAAAARQGDAFRRSRRAVLMDAPVRGAREHLKSGVVIPAHPLALTARRTLDERRQRALTRYYMDAGAGGVAVGVHTTQFAIREPRHGMYRPRARTGERDRAGLARRAAAAVRDRGRPGGEDRPGGGGGGRGEGARLRRRVAQPGGASRRHGRGAHRALPAGGRGDTAVRVLPPARGRGARAGVHVLARVRRDRRTCGR